jgi:hypothetical protein
VLSGAHESSLDTPGSIWIGQQSIRGGNFVPAIGLGLRTSELLSASNSFGLLFRLIIPSGMVISYERW